MAETAPVPVFGRRREPVAWPSPQAAPLLQATPALDTAALYARLTRDDADTDDAPRAFGAWRQTHAPGRRLAWAASLGLMASGAVCLILNAPPAVSTVLEAAGLVGGGWLRRERKRHLAAIRSWDEGAA